MQRRPGCGSSDRNEPSGAARIVQYSLPVDPDLPSECWAVPTRVEADGSTLTTLGSTGITFQYLLPVDPGSIEEVCTSRIGKQYIAVPGQAAPAAGKPHTQKLGSTGINSQPQTAGKWAETGSREHFKEVGANGDAPHRGPVCPLEKTLSGPRWSVTASSPPG